MQTGGGIRTINDIDEVIALGAERVVLGTAAVKNPEFLKKRLINIGAELPLVLTQKTVRLQ